MTAAVDEMHERAAQAVHEASDRHHHDCRPECEGPNDDDWRAVTALRDLGLLPAATDIADSRTPEPAGAVTAGPGLGDIVVRTDQIGLAAAEFVVVYASTRVLRCAHATPLGDVTVVAFTPDFVTVVRRASYEQVTA